MKKLAAILLMSVFVFNLFGYRLWVYIVEANANQRLSTTVENNHYSDDELLVIKKPISLPYYSNTESYTIANGEVEMSGIYYTFVKYRIYNNMLEMLCLPNTQKTNIKKAKDDYFTSTVDIQKTNSEKNKSNTSNVKKSFSDFEVYGFEKLHAITAAKNAPYSASYNLNLGLLYKETMEQPPDGDGLSV